LACDADLRARLGAEALRDANERHSLGAMLSGYQRIYDEVSQDPSGNGARRRHYTEGKTWQRYAGYLVDTAANPERSENLAECSRRSGPAATASPSPTAMPPSS